MANEVDANSDVDPISKGITNSDAVPISKGIISSDVPPIINLLYSFKVSWAPNVADSFVVGKFQGFKTACQNAGISYNADPQVRRLMPQSVFIIN